MIPGQTTSPLGRDHKGILRPHRADPGDPFFGLDGQDHVLLQRLVKSFGQHRVLIDIEADAVAEETGLAGAEAHESIQKLRLQIADDLGVNL